MTDRPEREAECAHCGLRLGRRVVTGEVGGEIGSYCCGGCLLAATVTRARGDPSVASALLIRTGLAAFFAMNVMMLTLPTYARHVYGDAAEGPLFVALRGIAAVLTVPVILLLGGPLVAAAGQGLRRGQATADLLIVLAVASAFALSIANLAAGRPETYFDTTVMLLVLVTGGRYLEATAKARATEAVRGKVRAGPMSAIRVLGQARQEVDAACLEVGDVVEVGPGSAFPADGRVIDGEGDVDESMLTGEARPRPKGVGSAVAGGTVSLDGRLRVLLERPASESAQARIEAILDAARAEPAAIERVVDRIAAWVVPAVLLASIGAGVWWWRVAGVDRGVLTAVAVLVVACPCGLVLATPVVLSRALASVAAGGIVVRSAPVLEALAAVRQVFFDKTGTLTGAEPRIVEVEVHSGDRSAAELLALAAAVEEGVAHPIARAVTGEARRRGLEWPAACDVRARPGRGVAGRLGETTVLVGSPAFVRDHGLATGVARLGERSADRLVVATTDGDLATLQLGESLGAGALDAVGALRAAGYRLGLLSGDAACAAEVRALFAPTEIATGLSADEKRAVVGGARRAGAGAVVMVGDGVNDAPALAAADVGVAVASAADLARLSADVAILSGGVAAVPGLFEIARRVRRILRQNLLWALAYNSVAVVLAATARLDPLIAAVAMIGSSILVLGNSSRIGPEWRSEVTPGRVQDRGTGIANVVGVARVDALN